MATDQLSRTFSALADPTRREILAKLSQGEATVNEIAAPFSISLPAVSRHLRVLEDAELISRGRDAQSRPAKLNAVALAPAANWINDYQEFWELSFDALDQHLKQEKKVTEND